MCEDNQFATGKLDKTNADLAKAGVINKLVQKQITAWADIRNSAAHGRAHQFKPDDVASMIRMYGGLSLISFLRLHADQ